MRSLFFLGGASLVSGLEARQRFEVARDDAVVLATPRVAEALDPTDWHAQRVVTTKPRGSHRLLHALTATSALVEFISRYGPFREVFVADLTTAMRLTALLASPAQVTVLDDGLFAPTTAAARQQAPRTFGERVLDPRAVRFFSAFGVAGRACDTVLVNDYRCLRARTQQLPSNGEDWIIGQPLVENQVMTVGDVTNMIDQVAGALRNPVYVCHPNERPEVIAHIASGLEVRRHALPLEIEVLRGTTRPASLSGFYSSGLVQPMFVMGDHIAVTSWRIPSERLRRAHEPIERAYEALGAIGERFGTFQLLDLASER